MTIENSSFDLSICGLIFYFVTEHMGYRKCGYPSRDLSEEAFVSINILVFYLCGGDCHFLGNFVPACGVSVLGFLCL